jgi:hypothetical protein
VLQRWFQGYTPIQPALAVAARHFSGQPAGVRRRSIVIVTDDEGSTPEPNVLRDLWAADAVVLGVIVAKSGAYGPGSRRALCVPGDAQYRDRDRWRQSRYQRCRGRPA